MSNRFEVLRPCRHPFAYAHEVAAAPRATTLLGEQLVVWRDTTGAVALACRRAMRENGLG